jgi:hypothetical protein
MMAPFEGPTGTVYIHIGDVVAVTPASDSKTKLRVLLRGGHVVIVDARTDQPGMVLQILNTGVIRRDEEEEPF